jgi:hypothetical protein
MASGVKSHPGIVPRPKSPEPDRERHQLHRDRVMALVAFAAIAAIFIAAIILAAVFGIRTESQTFEPWMMP